MKAKWYYIEDDETEGPTTVAVRLLWELLTERPSAPSP